MPVGLEFCPSFKFGMQFLKTAVSDLTELKVTFNVCIKLTCFHRRFPGFCSVSSIAFVPCASQPESCGVLSPFQEG